ncbi:MAG: DUF72 domain-containing protein [Gemmatimonadaceae bacterium]|nr:DUF72 domain-containing protein [Gemmatimonadaceae bacterium]
MNKGTALRFPFLHMLIIHGDETRHVRAKAPADFEFTIKAWQVITHAGTSPTYGRLKRPFTDRERGEAGGFRVTPTVLAAWETTLDAARALRVTAILFQCPASFKATDENVAAMRWFFQTVERPIGVRLLWEPRGAWPDERFRSSYTLT